MNIEQAKAELLKRAVADETYATFLAPGIGNLVNRQAPYDTSDMVLMDRPWLAPQQLGESLARYVNKAIAHTEQFARACEPLDHVSRTPEGEVRSQELGTTDYEMGLNARLENMHQKVQTALGHLGRADEGCEGFVAKLTELSRAIKENNHFFVAEAQDLRNQAEQL